MPNRDITVLFITRILRLFSYGSISVIFFQHLFQKGLTQVDVSMLQTYIIVGDIIISLYLTTNADRIGRKKTLIIGAILKMITGLTYSLSQNFMVLVISGIFGVISVTGGQIGPFMPIQQSALTHVLQETSMSKKQIQNQTATYFGYYNTCGYLSQAAGAFCTGLFIESMKSNPNWSTKQVINIVFYLYAVFGLLKGIMYTQLTRNIQVKHPLNKQMFKCGGLKQQSVKTIISLSILFAFDAWAGGFVNQAYLAYYYQAKFDLSFSSIGSMISICNIAGGLSGILSAKLVKMIGAMATMIFTHLPSNIFLILIAYSTQSKYAIVFLLLRFCISQMDVPARQTYVSMVVSSQQRSAANGITNLARSVGLSLAFPIAAKFLVFKPEDFYFSAPFIIAGGIKILYDITLGLCFLTTKQKKQVKNERFQQIQQFQQISIETNIDLKQGQEAQDLKPRS